MESKKTLILGASTNPSRYSFKAANRLINAGHEVVLVGNKIGAVAGKEIQQSTEGIENIDTVTLYLNPVNQKPYEEFILDLKPNRVIFNPGAENPRLMKKLLNQHIDGFEACTLVMLSTGQF